MNARINNSPYLRGVMISFFVLIFTGCTAFNTFPQAARGGDTVALAVGSPDGMSRANTTAVFEPGSIDLTANIRSIFRLYADKNSNIYNSGNATKSIVDNSGHEPWITVVAIDLPEGLPVGAGEIQFTTTAAYPTIGSHINNLPIQLEILPGTGSSSSFDYEFGLGESQAGDLTSLESLPHAQVIPNYPQGTAWPSYGAIEVKMDVPTDSPILSAPLNPPYLRVVLDDMSVQTAETPSLAYQHYANEELSVLLLSPRGRLKYYEARFSIALLANDYLPLSFAGTPSITSLTYYDVDGNEVSGPAIGDFTVELR